MPKRLTVDELTRRALDELTKAQVAHRETETLGRTAARTNRLRAANGRGYRHLKMAVKRGLSDLEARRLYKDNAASDPEFGTPEW